MDQAIARIRSATRALHDRLDASSYARRVLDGTLPIAAYVGFLRAVHEVHTALEQGFARADAPALAGVLGDVTARREALDADLTALAADRREVDRPVLHALALAQKIRLAGLREPAQLLGYAYVLEGSQLGGLVQHARLAQRPELREGGLRYLAAQGPGTRGEFAQFLARLAAALTEESAVDAAIAGAVACFEGFDEILEALDPERPAERWLTPALNVDAGTHAIPSDLRELSAAVRAGERSWLRFAYYEARYGERGLRFTRSDSAWLATVAREDSAMALRQFGWLARVLATRGMPRLLLELHLDDLHAALVDAMPEHAHAYQSLEEAARTLRDERLGALSDEQATLLKAAFVDALSPEVGITPEEAATLLLAAVADERCGISHAVAGLTAFLAGERFSPAWVAQVKHTLSRARKTLPRQHQSAS